VLSVSNDNRKGSLGLAWRQRELRTALSRRRPAGCRSGSYRWPPDDSTDYSAMALAAYGILDFDDVARR
jgi:hypothetical protein